MTEPSLDALLLDLCKAQCGVVSAAQAVSLGATGRQIRYRVKQGRLVELRRGIYHHALFEASDQMWMQALAIGGFGHASHRYAARLHGLEPYGSASPEVTVRRNSFQHLPPTIRVHESTQISTADIVTIDRLPVSGIQRTIMDVAAVERRQWAILAAIDSAVLAQKTDAAELNDCLKLHARRGRDGTVRFRRALEQFNQTGSLPIGHASRRLASLAKSSALPYPTFEDRVFVDDTFVAQSDLGWSVPLVAFSDGFTHHGSKRRQSSKDKQQRQTIRSAGAVVVEFTNDQLSQPGYVISTLRGAHREATIRIRKDPHRYRFWASDRRLLTGR